MLSSDAFIAFYDYYFGVSILVCYFFFGCLTNGSGVGVSSVVFPCNSVSIFALTHCKCFLVFYLVASQYSLYISNHQPPSSRLFFFFFIHIICTAVADIAMNVANKTNTSITLSMWRVKKLFRVCHGTKQNIKWTTIIFLHAGYLFFNSLDSLFLSSAFAGKTYHSAHLFFIVHGLLCFLLFLKLSRVIPFVAFSSWKILEWRQRTTDCLSVNW